MDLASTGSTITKNNIEASFKVAPLVERKIELNEQTPKEENKKEPKENEELTIDDFIDDFKL